MTSYLEVLYKETNLVIVQDPDRKYPGIVFQGDTLASIIGEVKH